MEEEIWKDIKGYEGKYQISNMGRVKSFNYYSWGKVKILRLSYTTKRYLQVCLTLNGVKKSWKIHTLVANAFIPNPDGKDSINHKNCIKTDNRLENLERCTNRENTDHAVRNGIFKNKKQGLLGEKNKFAKLKESDIIKMRKMFGSGMRSFEISKEFPSVSSSCVRLIVHRERWKHIK